MSNLLEVVKIENFFRKNVSHLGQINDFREVVSAHFNKTDWDENIY